MKKLMIAGCSFSAPSKTSPGTSWGEVLAKKLGWEVINLARQGCSNGGIRIQIDEIRRQRPDFAVITPTFWDRMEIPASAAPFDWNKTTAECEWSPDIQLHLQDCTKKTGYNPADGINNVNYGDNNYNMICETIYTLAENYSHPYRSGKINTSTQNAVKHYIDSIYDANWKKQMDEWIIVEGILQMFFDNLNFLVQPVLLWPFNPDNQNLWRSAFPTVIPDKYIMLNEKESVMPICGNNSFVGEDPGYHSSPEGQQIIADNWYRRITQDFGLH